MFGYVRYDLPNLFVKDYLLYQALYCGLCRSIGAACGQRARFGLTYDVTFLSALLHNMTGTDIRIERRHCAEHCIRKRPIAAVDELTKELGALNTALAYQKYSDDIRDGGRGRAARAWFKKGYRRAKQQYPAMVALVEEYVAAQEATERARVASLDAAAEPTAELMRKLSVHFLKERSSAASQELFYAIGKWVYLIDALDDYDKDRKKGRYNPFFLVYGSESRERLVADNGEEVEFLYDTLFYSMREGLRDISFSFNRDLTDNVILRGIPLETQRIIKGLPPQNLERTVRVVR